MITKFKLHLSLTLVLITLLACNNGPKVISSEDSKNSENSTGIFSESSSSKPVTKPNSSIGSEMHQVTVVEILPTTKYVYLNVKENDEQYWIATRKQDINIGETYFYKGGLLKTNFESKEHNKLFDKIYLVTSLVQANHSHNGNEQKPKTVVKSTKTSNEIIQQEGSIKISDLVENYKKYEGKTVQVSGKCVKINPNIMGINWIHIKDGTKDDYDLVITSNTFVKEGSIITMKAIVTLNKDFGAGYKYDLILENGVIVP
ncbi:MAG: hypothetical protein GQ552_07660 [Flavobacteriaceae bacterium]|nr:hypothetical protein [Flavobacteriaceae bacterium]